MEPARSAWDGDTGPGSLSAAQALDPKIASQQSGAFAHTQQSHRLRVGNLLTTYAASVVFDFHNNARRVLFQLNIHISGIRVANHVGKRFLEDAEESRREFGI